MNRTYDYFRKPGLALSVAAGLGLCTLPAWVGAESAGRMLQLEGSQPLDKEAMMQAAMGQTLAAIESAVAAEAGANPVNSDQLQQQIETLQQQLARLDQRPQNESNQARRERLEERLAELIAEQPAPNDSASEPDPSIEGAGCSVDPASPAIGANVPRTYFGIPAPTVNPSLIGPVQLLTSGQLDRVQRTITLPLYRGQLVTGEIVWYIATDTTDERNAEALGLNFSAKLAFADTGRGVRHASLQSDGLLVFQSGAVDFSPERQLVPNAEPNPFPPAVAQPGAVGDANYTPLVKIDNAGGHVWNMPIVAFGVSADEINFPDGDPDYSKVHDSVVAIDPINQTVTLSLVPGFSFSRPVLYLSTDANSPVTAALEGAILAPGLDDLTVGQDDGLFSPVERIFSFTNGPRGCDNPQRQGLNAAVTDGASPFNILGGIPTVATDYSPLWDFNLGEWTQEAIEKGFRSRLTEEFQILGFVENGFVTGPGGSPYGSTGIIINCPIVFRFL